MDIEVYNHIRSGGAGFHEQKRGLIAVWGKEAVQFLDGMITNDIKTLEDGQQMLAAFPNAQGRLLAVVRVLRQGDRFLFETEEATREKLFQNLFRFTFAGDFFVEDISDSFHFFELFGLRPGPPTAFGYSKGTAPPVSHAGYRFYGPANVELVALKKEAGDIRPDIARISNDLYEVLRIEAGIPKFGIDMDETTIVPELGFPEMISYTKGCYVGQEIIARIHFRGHVAKQLSGVTIDGEANPGDELTIDGKNAGTVKSVTYSPKLEKHVALAFVRYDHLADGTELSVNGHSARVTELPFIK